MKGYDSLMPVIIPPSSRPLLLWLAASAVCAAVLASQGLMLVALWRRPSWLWRLGLASLALGALGVGLASRLLDAYSQLAHVSSCYVDGCQDWFPLVTNAVFVAVILGGLLIAATCASVIAATALSATGRVVEGTTQARGWRNRGGRLALLAPAVAVAYLGMYWVTNGVAMLAQTVYLLTPGAAGDGIGMIPFEFAVVGTVVGAITLALGAWMVWAVAARREPTTTQAAAAAG
jgi:hypothetical protein